jgi:hypothetical protein
MHSAYPVNSIIVNLIILIILTEEIKKNVIE